MQIQLAHKEDEYELGRKGIVVEASLTYYSWLAYSDFLRRKRNGVFCTVPMPTKSTNIGPFVIK